MRTSAWKLIVSGVGLLMASQGHAGTTLYYSFKDLGTLGGNSSNALAINNASQITGYAATAPQGSTPSTGHVVIWSGSTVSDLGPGVGYAINAAGHVAGQTVDSSGNGFATLWANNTSTVLGAGKALSINDQDQVVGTLQGTDGVQRPAVWRNATATTLSNLGGEAHSINNAGQIVGWTTTVTDSETFPTAVRWVNDVAQTLGTHSAANAVNQANAVVGIYTPVGLSIPTVWSASGVARNFYSNSNPGNAYAINKAGLVVGHIYGEGALWDTSGDTPVYVSALTRMVTNLPSNVMQLMPNAINDKNEIVGSACYTVTNGTANCRAFLLTPTTPPVCEAKAAITSNVNLSFSATVTLSNFTANAATDWEVDVSLSDKTLLYVWQNAKVRTSGGSTVIGQPLSKSQAIASQGSTTFTFSGLKYASVQQNLTGMTATLGGQACTIRLNAQ